ncbi:MAG: TPM domain-containing protein [Burkholderiales bacterium]
MGKRAPAPPPPTPQAPRERTAAGIVTPELVRKVRIGLAVFGIVVLLLMFAVPRVQPKPAELSDPGEAFVDRVGLVSPAFAREWAGALLNDDRVQIAIFVDRKPPAGDLSAWAIQTASDWKIGAAKDDTGVVLFLFTEPRIARIDVGYGLEEWLGDARVRQLLEAHLAPAFAAGQYERGIDALVFAIRKEIGGYDADSIHARAAAARERNRVPWTTELATAVSRIPRVTVAIGKRFLEEGPFERLAMMVFIGVALGVLGIGFVGLSGALSSLAATPAAIREVRSGQAPAMKLGGLAFTTTMGFFVAFTCVSLVMMVLLVSESYFTRQGRFSGAGALIVWPQPPR